MLRTRFSDAFFKPFWPPTPATSARSAIELIASSSTPPSTVFAPKQPVTITRPFAASASPIVSKLSFTASSMKPQVFTITKSAPSNVFDVSYPSAESWVKISSESVSAFGQPRLTKPTFGLLIDPAFSEFIVILSSVNIGKQTRINLSLPQSR